MTCLKGIRELLQRKKVLGRFQITKIDKEKFIEIFEELQEKEETRDEDGLAS